MLYYFADYLINFDSGFRVFHYLTFRAILAVLTSLIISFIIGPTMICKLSRNKIGQSIRELGPQSHYEKAGTPTMGGALILVAITLTTLLWADLSNRYIWVILLVTLGYGVIGFIDDYRKVMKGNSDGLSAKSKYLWQSIIGFGAALFLFKTAVLPAETQFFVPFFKDLVFDMGWFYVIFAYFVIVWFCFVARDTSMQFCAWHSVMMPGEEGLFFGNVFTTTNKFNLTHMSTTLESP